MATLITPARQLRRKKFRRFSQLLQLESRVCLSGVSSAPPDVGIPSVTMGGSNYFNFDGLWPAAIRSISDDGRFSLFVSKSPGVVAGVYDANAEFDLFLHDSVAGQTILVSRSADDPSRAANGASDRGTMSADGRYVAFLSRANDLVAGMPKSPARNVFVFDRVLQTVRLASRSWDSPTVGVSYDAMEPVISGDGSRVAFRSDSINLLPTFPASQVDPGNSSRTQSPHSYSFELATGAVQLINHVAGSPTSYTSVGGYVFDLSYDGRYAVLTGSWQLVSPTTTVLGGNAYRYDFQTQSAIRITNAIIGGAAGSNGGVSDVRMSPDGRWFAFRSSATNLVPGYVGSDYQMYLYDAVTQTTTLVSRAAGTTSTAANRPSSLPAVSNDGRHIAYWSAATDLVPGFVGSPQGFVTNLYVFDAMTGQSRLVTRKAGTSATSTTLGVGLSDRVFSADGTRFVFAERSGEMIAGFESGSSASDFHVYLYDVTSDTVSLQSHRIGTATAGANGGSTAPNLSADGTKAIFYSFATDLVPSSVDLNGAQDVFIRNIDLGTTAVVSGQTGTPSATPGGETSWARQSRDGRFVTFTSTATNIVAGQVDQTNTRDVFVTDRLTGVTRLVSRRIGTATAAGNGESQLPVISGDGRYVAYSSFATDLVPGFIDANGDAASGNGGMMGTDVFLFDTVTETTQLVSRAVGTPARGGNSSSAGGTDYHAHYMTISDDGRYVGYGSAATDLVNGLVTINANNPRFYDRFNVYAFDRVTQTNRLISHTAGSNLNTGNAGSIAPVMSGDGRYITYWSDSSLLVAGITSVPNRQVYVYDQVTGVTTLVSHHWNSPTTPTAGGSNAQAISRDGNFIVYHSASNVLVPGQVDFNGLDDVFLYNRQTGVNTLVSRSVSSPVTTGNARSELSDRTHSFSISDDGRYVVFTTASNDMVPNWVDVPAVGYEPTDVYLYDRLTNSNRLVSRSLASESTAGNGTSFQPSISGDGRFVAFSSQAADLTPDYSNPFYIYETQVYVFDQWTNRMRLASRDHWHPSAGGNGRSDTAVLSTQGDVVLFLSRADNVAARDFNAFRDALVFVTETPIATVQVADGSSQRSVVRSVTVTLDQPVLFAGEPAAAFVLRRGAEVVPVTASVTVGLTTTVTLTFTGPATQFGSLADGRYTLTVLSSEVTGIEPLDGNADGTPGDDFVFAFHRLFGDADGDAKVDAMDFLAFRLGFQNNAPAFDHDGNGTVTASDFLAFRLRFLISV